MIVFTPENIPAEGPGPFNRSLTCCAESNELMGLSCVLVTADCLSYMPVCEPYVLHASFINVHLTFDNVHSIRVRLPMDDGRSLSLAQGQNCSYEKYGTSYLS